MYSERLFLKASLQSSGWEEVDPPVVLGESGISQRFTCVARKGQTTVAFDVYDMRVDGIEMIASYIKKFDTRVMVVVLGRGAPTELASQLSGEYGMPILAQEAVADFLSNVAPLNQVARIE